MAEVLAWQEVKLAQVSDAAAQVNSRQIVAETIRCAQVKGDRETKTVARLQRLSVLIATGYHGAISVVEAQALELVLWLRAKHYEHDEFNHVGTIVPGRGSQYEDVQQYGL